MAISQLRSLRKPSGGRYKQTFRKKRAYELGREPAFTGLGKKRIKYARARSNHRKIRVLSTDTANLFDPKTKKYEQIKIKTIAENPANRHFVRRNIMTKGTIIETERGRAKITSRPGQHGVVNAVLLN
ncbi:30S ribosomal protein S8e [Candidatus Woesearchaeota archaeon]|nr:30S ribosomal protein S8e [Candidatus Woesearchaeota archaeon]